jgi:hypothetical protein
MKNDTAVSRSDDDKTFAIIEIGSNNTKTHVYRYSDPSKAIFDSNTTIEFKANYKLQNKVSDDDVAKLLRTIGETARRADEIHIYGCSIFRNISDAELSQINRQIKERFNAEITVVSQKDEAFLTAYGCYGGVNYAGNIGIFIGGGGSIEIIVVSGGKIIEAKFLDFGVVDITSEFPTLKDDVPTATFGEVQSYVSRLIGKIENQCDVLILAGGDHFYWYNNANFPLEKNTLYQADGQEYMLTIADSDRYDNKAYQISLDAIRARSDNPKWFDGSRAMKAATNAAAHIVGAKYIVPTKINMEDGLKEKIIMRNLGKLRTV